MMWNNITPGKIRPFACNYRRTSALYRVPHHLSVLALKWEEPTPDASEQKCRFIYEHSFPPQLEGSSRCLLMAHPTRP
ncbi:hypothetical protein VTI74DRAFT_10084 [Chaetomium olivicolor]